MNTQVIDKIKEILGLTEEVNLTQTIENSTETIKLMDWKLEDGRIIKIHSDNSVTIDDQMVADGDYMVINPENEEDIRVLRVKDGKVDEIIDANEDVEDESELNSMDEMVKRLEQSMALVQDLNNRLTLIESMMMESKKSQEQLSSIVEVIKNSPSGEPIQKKETSEFSLRKKTRENKETKFYDLGKKLKK